MSRSYKKPYSGAKAFDSSCRCHGGCLYCHSNRMYNTMKRQMAADFELEEYYNNLQEIKNEEKDQC